jgi:hypothetical protein
MKARTLTSAVLATIGGAALLAGAALAATTVAPDTDSGNPTPPGTAISTLARTTTEVGEAKGDAISAAATALDPENSSASSLANPAAESAPGAAISELAMTTTAVGAAKGAAISAAAQAIHSAR